MEEFNTASFEQMLTSLKGTQESIQALSVWCLKNRANHKKVVASWLSVLKQVKVEHRLVLFYLANDVIQHSKRKHFEYVDSWGTTLQRATTMVRDEKVKSKIIRIFNIWEERSIYNDDFLSDLRDLLSINPAKKQQTVVESDDEQVSLVSTNIRTCVRLEQETDKTFKKVNKTPKLYDTEGIQALKDRRHVEDVEHGLEEYSAQLETYLRTLSSELEARKMLLTVLEQTDAFYHNQRGEVKVVANAYRSFGNRIKTMKRKLDELCTTLPSPIPSPDINAPSPEPDNDFDLPDLDGDKSFDQSFLNTSNGFLSLDQSKLPFNISDFKSDSPTSDGQPIQVIGSSNVSSDTDTSKDLGADFNIDEFFKSLLHEPDLPTSIYSSPHGSSSVPQPVPPISSTNQTFTASVRYTEIPGMGNFDPQPPTTNQHHHHGSYNQGPSNQFYSSPVPPSANVTPAEDHPYRGPASQSQSPSQKQYQRPSSVPTPPSHQNPFRSAPHPNSYSNHTPLAPPPPPPNFEGDHNHSDEYNPESWDLNTSWNSERNDSFNRSNSSIRETPSSPPHYDRTNQTQGPIPREYIDRSGEWPMSGTTDVDQRQLRLPDVAMSAINKDRIRSLDVDHRNLISLTGSPTGKPNEPLLMEPQNTQVTWKEDMRTNVDASVSGTQNATLLPTPTKIPLLEPPPQMSNNLMEMLNNTEQQSTVNTSMPPPSFNSPPPSALVGAQRQPFKRSPSVGSYSRDGTPIKRRISGGQPDIVEAIDMEMSDEDYEESHLHDGSSAEEDNQCDMYEEQQQHPHNQPQQQQHNHQQQQQIHQQQQQQHHQQTQQQHQQNQHQHQPHQQQHQRPPRPFHHNNFGQSPGGGGGCFGGNFGFQRPNNPRNFFQSPHQTRHMMPNRGWVNNNTRRQRPNANFPNVWTNNSNNAPNPRNPFSFRKF